MLKPTKLTRWFTKQAFGRMVKNVLESFGHRPDRKVPSGISAEFVTAAITINL